jgi:hypothetical protein
VYIRTRIFAIIIHVFCPLCSSTEFVKVASPASASQCKFTFSPCSRFSSVEVPFSVSNKYYESRRVRYGHTYVSETEGRAFRIRSFLSSSAQAEREVSVRVAVLNAQPVRFQVSPCSKEGALKPQAFVSRFKTYSLEEARCRGQAYSRYSGFRRLRSTVGFFVVCLFVVCLFVVPSSKFSTANPQSS